jgi:hypothetical protein
LYPGHVGDCGESVVQRGEINPGFRGLALGVLVAVDAQSGGVGEIGAEFQEERTKVVIDRVEVEVINHGSRGHDPRVGRSRGGVAPLFGTEDPGLLLGPTDEQHPLRTLGSGQVLMHDVVLALTLHKIDQRHSVRTGVAADPLNEVLAHRRHQRGGRDLKPPLPGQEPDDLSDALQLRDIDVQIHPVEGLDLEHHVLGEDISSSTR